MLLRALPLHALFRQLNSLVACSSERLQRNVLLIHELNSNIAKARPHPLSNASLFMCLRLLVMSGLVGCCFRWLSSIASSRRHSLTSCGEQLRALRLSLNRQLSWLGRRDEHRRCIRQYMRLTKQRR